MNATVTEQARAADAIEAAAFRDLYAAAPPGLRAQLGLDVQGTDGWLGAGAVRAESRGRHAHRALMALRVREAIAAGCARIFTETGEPVSDEPNPSLANMQWSGFRRVASRLNYAAPAAT
jgi:hypothetical protein